MERDYTDVIRDKSQFKDSAERKISDRRSHEDFITDVNRTTESAFYSSTSIHDKLAEYKYEQALRTGNPVYPAEVFRENESPGNQDKVEISSADNLQIGNGITEEYGYLSNLNNDYEYGRHRTETEIHETRTNVYQGINSSIKQTGNPTKHDCECYDHRRWRSIERILYSRSFGEDLLSDCR